MYSFVLTSLFISCQNSGPKAELSAEDKTYLIDQIEAILELDQKYRKYISLGTLNDSIVKEDAIKSKDLDIEEYMAYRKTLDLELPKATEDSLWALQHELDIQNHVSFVEIVKKYGYPSSERLGIEQDRLFPILLHPPTNIEIPEFIKNMQALLLPEVKCGRMPARMYASFYDNMKAKILNEPQLYGTGKTFDSKTMTMGPPKIENIEKTNEARKEIGLDPLKANLVGGLCK